MFVNGSYSKNEMGEPQLLNRKGADATSTEPLGSKAAGQSLHTIVWPPTLGMFGPAVHTPVPVGCVGGV